MEGDILLIFLPKAVLLFQSTPSAWRETAAGRAAAGNFDISIHSLRMEGDDPAEPEITTKNISIHSLRMEGDRRHRGGSRGLCHFNPLPPHGGRLFHVIFLLVSQ